MLYSLFTTIFSFFEDKKNNSIKMREIYEQRIGENWQKFATRKMYF